MARNGFAARAVRGDATGIYGVASDTNAREPASTMLYFGLARPVKLTPVSMRYARLVCRTVRIFVGEWLSLVEHLVRDQGVGGSNPLSPTI
jgi:hypothetical protein